MSETVLVNQYSGEHRVRSTLAEVLADHDYHVVKYTLTDDGEERRLTVVACRTLGAQQTRLNFNLDPDSHPDHV